MLKKYEVFYSFSNENSKRLIKKKKRTHSISQLSGNPTGTGENVFDKFRPVNDCFLLQIQGVISLRLIIIAHNSCPQILHAMQAAGLE